jgi:hypothetical protein
MTKNIIDEDGEALLPIEEMILDKLKNIKAIHCLDEEGNELSVDYWNPEATNEDGIPDIVVACHNGTAIFWDDLKDAKIIGDKINVAGYNLTLI